MTPPSLLTVRSSRYLAYGFGVFVFIVGILLDILMIDLGTSRALMLVITNLVTGIAAGIVAWLVARNEVLRRIEESHRLIVLDEMNHHIRNALQAVVLCCYSMEGESAQTLTRAVERIQWSLTEVLPKVSFEERPKPAA